ncbi:MAG: TIGR00282 family metallophosphoesterase [Clostridia bacterium]|nr:TIGR00282 family metallophosphoesterase [Clostridia bacterium]
MRVLFIGDIMGRTGREAVADFLPDLKYKRNIDICIANGENASGGLGMSIKAHRELSACGVDCFTMGNHTFSKREIISLLENGENIVRPANISPESPGRGMAVLNLPLGLRIGVINILGRVFMNEAVSDPFECAEETIVKAKAFTDIIVVDFHAEATSEKQAMGYYLDGTVSAVLGTHTHVQTADERILPKGSAYITDVGMCGASDSVLGMEIVIATARLVEPEIKHRFAVAKGKYQLCGCIIEIDELSGKARGIERICIRK